MVSSISIPAQETNHTAQFATDLLCRHGLDARTASALPESGIVVLLQSELPAWIEHATQWVSATSDRRLIVEPSEDANQSSPPWSGLIVGQRRQCPVKPASELSLDQFLSEVIEMGWEGYEHRLHFRRPLPPDWVGYIFLLGHLFHLKTNDAQWISRASQFAQLDYDTPFANCAWALLQQQRSGCEGNRAQTYILNRLQSLPCSPPADDPRPEHSLLIHAHRVAGDDDAQSWREVLSHIDPRRGLIRKHREAAPGQWQMHPILLCAVARRLNHFQCGSVEPVHYPTRRASSSDESIWFETDDSICQMRSPLLSDLASRREVPDLNYPHDFSEQSDLLSPEKELIAMLGSVVPDLQSNPPSWPMGHRFALSIRHDVDRPLTREDLDRHLNLEATLGCRSTWYFKSETFDNDLARIILHHGHEVAYHAELLSTGDDGFVDRLRRWLGHSPGMTFHGGMGSEGFRGKRSLKQCADLQVAYAELPIGRATRPVLWFGDNVRPLPVTALPVKWDVFPDQCREHAEWLIDSQGHVIVENHPDRFEESYCRFLQWLTTQHPVCLTIEEAVRHFYPNRS